VTATLANTGSSYSGTTHYQYDYGQSVNPQASRSQLTQATSTSYTGTENYLYDQSAPGQPGSSTGPGNATSFFEGADHSYNADNQLVGEGYDGNGNPTNYHSQTLTFDPENRLTSYGSVQTDGYSGDGLRAWKQTGGSTTRTYFLYDGSQPVGEYDSTGALRAANVFGADGLLSRLDPSSPVNSGRTYYSFDGRGAVTQRLYANGNPYQTDLYFANGYRSERLLDYSDPFGFGGQAGYYTDLETGLMLCTHRFYDPNVGRFLTRDLLGYDGGINLYGYTQNNPVNRSDPSGLDGSTDCSGPMGEAGASGPCTSSDAPSQPSAPPETPTTGGSMGGNPTPEPITAPTGVPSGSGGGGGSAGGGGGVITIGGGSSTSSSNPPGTSVPGPGFVVAPNGTAIPIPPGYEGRVADNGKGLVYQNPCDVGNNNAIRVADPNAMYPDGYARFYNGAGQPTNAAGKPGPHKDTHFPL